MTISKAPLHAVSGADADLTAARRVLTTASQALTVLAEPLDGELEPLGHELDGVEQDHQRQDDEDDGHGPGHLADFPLFRGETSTPARLG